jgi:hypothetical protein
LRKDTESDTILGRILVLEFNINNGSEQKLRLRRQSTGSEIHDKKRSTGPEFQFGLNTDRT